MKKSRTVIIILAVLSAVLLIITAVSQSRAAELKDHAAKTIFYALRAIDERLDRTASSGEYTARDSETVCRALAEIETAVNAAEKLYSSPLFRTSSSFLELADALGCSHYSSRNGVPVESVLYDGELSANEHAFISELSVEVNRLIEPMLAEDGLNIRDDLTYGEIREPLDKFIEKWGFWAGNSTSRAPYWLLNSEDADK